MGKNVIIGGRIHNPEVGNVAVGANEVLDDTKVKKQNVINAETDAELLRLENEKQDNLSFDNTPTENSTNPITSGGVYASELLIHQAIEMILALIPSAASALNQLADKSFVNSTVATATATFWGTYNVVTDLGLEFDATHEQIAAALLSHIATADNNDYAFVQIPVSETSTDIRVTERYKFNGTAWAYEYDLNNSGFTALQWAAINSGITALLVEKLGALPTAAELALALAGKQATITFDNVPTAGSNNPVKSGGLYELFTAINAKFPANASADNKLVAEDRLAAYVAAIIGALDATYNVTSTDGHVTVKVTQADGAITIVEVLTSDIASASALTTLTGRVTTLTGRVSTNETDIANLQAAYAALTQNDVIIVNGALPSSGQQQNKIYRQPDQEHTPPQFYSDYMWNGSTWVLMATYNNAIDAVPTAGSHNLVESGGVKDSILDLVSPDNLFDQTKLKEGYYVEATNGVEYPVQGYGYLYINVDAESLYILSRDNTNIAFFDASGTYLTGEIAKSGKPFITPNGCTKMTVSIMLSWRGDFRVFKGITLYPVKDVKVIGDTSIKLDSILPESVNREKFSMAYAARNVGKNLYDKDSQGIVRGYYVNALNGQREELATFCYLAIPCLPGTQYTLQGEGNSHIAFFDVLQQYISGVLYKGTFTTPANCSYMVVSVAIANLNKIQLEIGASATEYLPYQLCILKDSIPYRSISEMYLTAELKEKLRRNGRIITVGTGKDYTTVLEALQNAVEYDTIVLDSGVYDIEQEYKDVFGSDYFDEYSTNYNQDNPDAGWFNHGLHLYKGVSLIGNGNVTISFPWSGDNTNVKTYFAILNPTADNTIKNITIEAGNGNCRYHIHDDWANDSASMCGVNIMENIVFKGTTFYTTCIGGGMGIGNTYIVKDCIFLSSDVTSISYHNSVSGDAENLLYITNCYCNGKIIVLSYGSSTKITYCSIKGNRCTEIVHSKTTQESEDNTVILDWGNIIPN